MYRILYYDEFSNNILFDLTIPLSACGPLPVRKGRNVNIFRSWILFDILIVEFHFPSLLFTTYME